MRFLPALFYLLFIIYYLLFIVYYLLFIIYYLLFIICCLSFACCVSVLYMPLIYCGWSLLAGGWG